MKYNRNSQYFKSALIFAIMALAILVAGMFPDSSAYAKETKISKSAIELLSKNGEAMAEVISAVRPAVVNISSTHTVKMQGVHQPFLNDPMLKRFFGEEFGTPEHPKEFKQASLGSGVIVNEDGYILTNYHVIKDADEIKIRLSDQREFKGKVIGSDPKTDLAVVRIDARDLPVLKMGDSGSMKVGETVIAIGNPFGLNQTVTSGIVSAVGRANVGIADYEDFIQTDAAINPGNSGGALVNVRGELIGINTAIFSTSGGYQGIGFAIPSNMAKVVMEALIKNGKVIRGWLGVAIQAFTPELAKQFGLKEEKGVLVGDVTAGSPAEKAGIQRGDIITKYNGRSVKDPAELRNMVAGTPPQKKVSIELLREGKPETVTVTIAEFPVEVKKAAKEFDNLLKGVRVQELTAELSQKLNVPHPIHGVIVADIEEGSFASTVLAPGDIIMEINKKPVRQLKDYENVVSLIKPDQPILLLLFRGGTTIYVTLSTQ